MFLSTSNTGDTRGYDTVVKPVGWHVLLLYIQQIQGNIGLNPFFSQKSMNSKETIFFLNVILMFS